MSSYRQWTKHPLNGKWYYAWWLSDYLGWNHYGVLFDDKWEKGKLVKKSKLYDPLRYFLETKGKCEYERNT